MERKNKLKKINKRKLLKMLMDVTVMLAIIISPIFVFLLVWMLMLGNIALIQMYLDIDLSSGGWEFISIFGSMALAGRFAIGTYSIYKYHWGHLKFLIYKKG